MKTSLKVTRPHQAGTGIRYPTGESVGLQELDLTSQVFTKEHWTDTACVGESGASITIPSGMVPLLAKATGHGNRQMCGTNAFGFPIRPRSNQKIHRGFQTGDMVTADVPKGKKQGVHCGRVLVRATGSFDIQTKSGRVTGVSHKHCTATHRKDGYAYH